MTKTTTRPAVAIGATSGPPSSRSVCSGGACGSWTCTGTGFGSLGLGAALGLLLGRRGRLFQLLTEIAQHLRGALDHAAARDGDAQVADLGAQVPLVRRQVVGQMDDLVGDDRAEAEQRDEEQQDHREDRRYPAEAEAAQPDHDRREHEAQQDRERERDQDVAADVERADDHDDRRRPSLPARPGAQPCPWA